MIAFRPVLSSGHGQHIPTQVIDTAFTRHPDGFGVAWRENGTVFDAKFGPGSRKAFRRALKRLDKRDDIEYVAHWRFATQGPKNVAMAHPYEYIDPKEGRVLVFHNGIINIAARETESDTHVFVRDVLSRLPTRWWARPEIKFLVGQSIGWSKLVIMTGRETVNLQEHDGTWDGGLWYSSNHRPLVSYQTYPIRKGHWLRNADGTPGGKWVYDDEEAKPILPGNDDDEDWALLTGGGDYSPTLPSWQRHNAIESAKALGLTDGLVEVIDPETGESLGSFVDPDAPMLSRDSTDDPVLTIHDMTGTRALIPYEGPIRPDRLYQFSHGGHSLTAVRDINRDVDGDHPQSLICDTCYTMGDVYIIEGVVFIDMAHRTGTEAEVERNDEDGLLAPIVAQVRDVTSSRRDQRAARRRERRAERFGAL